MKYLTILRHAKSSWKFALLPDKERPLNERGKKAVIALGKYLSGRHIKPDAIICSPALRSVKTARGVAKAIGVSKKDIHVINGIYEADAMSLFSIIKDLDNSLGDVVLVGHEPGLSEVIKLLTGKTIEKFPTCAAYRINFNIEHWSAIKSGTGKCEFYVNPKLLEEKKTNFIQ